MGFGFRSVEKWTMAVGRWKSKVKAKAAQLRIESQKTGGGCLNAAPLTDTEARLMKLIGWKSGSIRPIAAHQPLPELKPFIEENTSNTATPDPQPSCSTVSKSPPTLRLLNQEPARKRSRLSTEKSRKFVSLAKMHQEAMEERKKLSNDRLKPKKQWLEHLKNFWPI
ncbi:unnamed protein product [Acanthoscelides obtectus]|uniref:Uncharacterized protein n=1 Tax=Acanthoscelides obtectus TaxID=200917 RepID=A0A9P0LH58_ACAOB|nr:unnamed protein product [Acanthoscelides obtectus]CAK1642017.1 hypothetical protein AOBTE_LOCUS12791 [Acanthoscelides obtectus]